MILSILYGSYSFTDKMEFTEDAAHSILKMIMSMANLLKTIVETVEILGAF